MHDARPGRLLWAIVPALLCAVAATAAEPFRVERTERYAADHLIVKFAPGARRLGVAAMEAHVGARAVRRLRSSGAVLMKLPAGRHVDEVIERVRSSPGVRSARRDHYLHIHATTPDDPDFVSC